MLVMALMYSPQPSEKWETILFSFLTLRVKKHQGVAPGEQCALSIVMPPLSQVAGSRDWAKFITVPV
jgi:hypothetical protein